MTVEILYEDNHVLVVNKPVNCLSQGDRSGDLDLLTQLKQMIKVRDHKPGQVYLGLVHRLDRPVGGVMVFAKTSKAAGRLAKQLQSQQFDRVYWAVVEGDPGSSGQLDHYLYKDQRKNQVYAVDAKHPKGKKARLTYQRLAQSQGRSLVQVRLHTGRSHQIRVQFKTAGHPLWGDQKYNSKAQPGQQIALWAYQLQFNHPTRKEPVAITCRPPSSSIWQDFQALISQ